MAAAEVEENVEGGSLEITPTWAVALVCSVFVLASFALERAIHYGGRWLKRRKEKSLNQALDKIKEELMLLGFISLLLTVFQTFIANICVPHDFIHHMLPCRANTTKIEEPLDAANSSPEHSRRLLAEHMRRTLAEAGNVRSKCYNKNKLPFLSAEGLHELHIFIFVLAIVHVVYSCLTLLLGRYKVHGWNTWEKQVQAEVAQRDDRSAAAEMKRLTKLDRKHTFLRKHANRMWISSDILSWIVCFFRQFGKSVTDVEYLTLRNGFIRNHSMPNTFDFHKYVLRVLEDDFKKVVGISAYLWIFVVLFLLLNVNGWHTYFWIAFLPLGLLLIVGAKLQHVIMALAIEIAEEQKSDATLVVTPRDELFWFNRPKLILYLLHFILFQNAFELAFFFWIWAAFGFRSCFMENLYFVITRLVIGVIVQVMCSYSTLPLYALVTQMGKEYKFSEKIQGAITSWVKSSHHGANDKDETVNQTPKAVSAFAAAASAAKKSAAAGANGKNHDNPSEVEMASQSNEQVHKPKAEVN